MKQSETSFSLLDFHKAKWHTTRRYATAKIGEERKRFVQIRRSDYDELVGYVTELVSEYGDNKIVLTDINKLASVIHRDQRDKIANQKKRVKEQQAKLAETALKLKGGKVVAKVAGEDLMPEPGTPDTPPAATEPETGADIPVDGDIQTELNDDAPPDGDDDDISEPETEPDIPLDDEEGETPREEEPLSSD